MSTVFYRWGAGRDESRVTFDGTHISVFDLKREIILNNKMGNGKDFDIGIYDNVTGDEFKDDNHQIPRSSSLIARRLPSSIKGRGNAQNYIVGTSAADSLNNDHRIEAHARDAMLAKQARATRGAGGMYGSMTKRFDEVDKEKEPAAPITTGDVDEDARIQAMLAQNAENWEQMQEEMSMQGRAGAAQRARKQAAGPSNKPKFEYGAGAPRDKEPPLGYICYRCGQKGHWIEDCPNNDDPQAQEKKRYVRVTGIPRSFLKTVESPLGNEGSSQGAMLTADGGFVQAMPDKRQWQKVVTAKPRTLTSTEVRDQQPLDASLTCPICKKLLWEAVRTPCCDTAFCEECITNHLLEHDFECPACESKVASLEGLKADEGLRVRIKEYMDSEIERSKREEEEERKNEVKEEGKSEDGSVAPATEGQVDSAAPAVPPIPKSATFDPVKMQEMMNPQNMQIFMAQIAKMLQNPAITAQAKLLLQAQLQMVQTNMQMSLLSAGSMLGGPQALGAMNNGMGAPMGMGMGMGMGMPNMPMGNMNMNMMNMNMGFDNNFNMPMPMPMPMDMPMGMGMGMGMNNFNNNHNGMGMGFNNGMGPGPGPGPGFNNGMDMNGMGMNMGGRGRGGFRGGGGFRGRGGGGGGRNLPIPVVRPPKRNGDDAELDHGGFYDKQQRVG